MASSLAVCNCSNALAPEDFDDYTKYTLNTARTRSTDQSEDSSVLNCNYKFATPIFRAIEKENWTGVLLFLTTGRWSNSLLMNANEHLRAPPATTQVKTWVTSYDRRGVPEWSQLPIHAAISYNAPYVVIQKLVDLYPKSIQCTDSEGMLPIHLAYGFGASDCVLAALLVPFPSSLNERGLGGRYPYECCELGPNKARGEVYRIVADQISNRVNNSIEKEWKDFLKATARSMQVELPKDLDSKTLNEFVFEAMKVKKELDTFKRQGTVNNKSNNKSNSKGSVVVKKSESEDSLMVVQNKNKGESTSPMIVSQLPQELTRRRRWGVGGLRRHHHHHHHPSPPPRDEGAADGGPTSSLAGKNSLEGNKSTSSRKTWGGRSLGRMARIK